MGESAQCQDPLAQRGRQSGLTKDMLSPTERSEARVCSCQRQESLGANPRTGFRQVPLMLWLVAGTRGTALVLGWL